MAYTVFDIEGKTTTNHGGGNLRDAPGICVSCEAEAIISAYSGKCRPCRNKANVQARKEKRALDRRIKDVHPPDIGCQYHKPTCVTCPFPDICILEEATPEQRERILVMAGA